MKPVLLVLMPATDATLTRLRESFQVLYAPTPDLKREFVQGRGAEIRAVLTIGTIGLSADEIDALPALSIVSALGVGFEKIAVDHAKSRGIATVNGAGTNADCVADHAFGLMLAVVRAIPSFDAACRRGWWRDKLEPMPTFSGKRLGILGFGTIGAELARRAAGFDLEVGYHNRRRRDDLTHRYFDSVRALAEWSDYLVVATPGGADTRHLIDADVLTALGSTGYLINISRGSVVDTDALAQALRAGRIAGAGLDVYESEPAAPTVLFDCPNVVLTPHTAGTSPEANEASVGRFIENARLHFAGEPPISPI